MAKNKKRPSASSTSASASRTRRPKMTRRKADVELTVAKYGADFLTAVVSAISAEDGEPLKLTKNSFKAMAVQKPNGWSTSDTLTVGSVYKPTPGIHVFALTGFANGVPPGPYAIAVTVTGAWQGQAIAKIQV